ncbi:PAAR-like domain-containing protein [Polyangium spumosum]|uniref:PAAR-like domain-containing protein n=1 Tax=Polyangium spumosum TaxID=889282 RepID=UPI00129A826D
MSGEWARECGEALVVSIAPDVCWTPVGGALVAVPYMIVARLDKAEGTDPNHLICDKPAFTTASRIPEVEGDEAGTGGGLISGVNRGYCRPLEHSSSSMAGDHWLVREGDLFAMNCAGPEGPANTYGRLVISNDAASAPGVSLSKSANTTVDPATGIVVVETAEKTEDPETGAITELRERSVTDPTTGRVEVQRVKVTTHADGSKTYEASSGAFDPASKQYEWRTSTGGLPEGEIDPDELSLDENGRLYLDEDAEGFVPSDELDQGDDIADDDPEVLADPEVKAALEEEAACKAELEATNNAIRWEGFKLGVDAAGILDPTPASDLTGAALALADGDWLGGGLSVVSAVVPYAGDALAKGVKAARAAKALAKLDRLLLKWQAHLANAAAAVRKAKQAAKKKLARKKAGGIGAQAPKNPGDGGFAPRKKKQGGTGANGDGGGPKAPRKPHQPVREKWEKSGGTVRDNPDGSTTFRRKDGVEVTYDKDGFPDFSRYRHPEVNDVQIEFTGNYRKDTNLADEAAGITERKRLSEGYTWHHHQDGKTMQLVKSSVHRDFFHTGGMSKTR